MAIRKIVLMGDEALRTPGDEITEFDNDLRALIEDMWETMYHAEGIGLAATQIGVPLRVCVLDIRDEDNPESGRLALVNPVISRASKKRDKALEGCLSIPGLEEVIKRSSAIRVEAVDIDGGSIELETEGLIARVPWTRGIGQSCLKCDSQRI